MLYYKVLSACSTPYLSSEQMSYHDIPCHGICEVLPFICALIARGEAACRTSIIARAVRLLHSHFDSLHEMQTRC